MYRCHTGGHIIRRIIQVTTTPCTQHSDICVDGIYSAPALIIKALSILSIEYYNTIYLLFRHLSLYVFVTRVIFIPSIPLHQQPEAL